MRDIPAVPTRSRKPEQWTPMFLATLALRGSFVLACFHAHVTEAEVDEYRALNVDFDTGYRVIMRELRRRGLATEIPASTSEPPVSRFSQPWMQPFLLGITLGHSAARASKDAGVSHAYALNTYLTNDTFADAIGLAQEHGRQAIWQATKGRVGASH